MGSPDQPARYTSAYFGVPVTQAQQDEIERLAAIEGAITIGLVWRVKWSSLERASNANEAV